jgi:hypothetical protein
MVRVAAAAAVVVAAAGARVTLALPVAHLFPEHLTVALNLVNGLVNQTNANNSYSYALPPAVSWGPTAFANQSDCSSFVCSLLEQAYGLSATNIKTLAGTTKATGSVASWPQAATWYTAVTAGTPGTCMPVVPTLAQVVPGDLIFVKYPAGSSDADGDTGHAMLVAAAPQQLSSTAKPVVSGTTEWSLQVVDVTADPHGTADTRYEALADGTNAAGAGIGTIRIYVNTDGSTAGYSWSPLSGSVFEAMSVRPLVFCRPTAAPLLSLAAGGAVTPTVKGATSTKSVRR